MASGISSHARSTGMAANFSDVGGSESDFLYRATPNERDGDEDRSSGAANVNGVVRRVACDVCRERKVRCDKGQPHCGRCGRLGHICRYTTSRKQYASKLDISDALLTLNARLGKYCIAIHSSLAVYQCRSVGAGWRLNGFTVQAEAQLALTHPTAELGQEKRIWPGSDAHTDFDLNRFNADHQTSTYSAASGPNIGLPGDLDFNDPLLKQAWADW